jgi:hypothetical protein
MIMIDEREYQENPPTRRLSKGNNPNSLRPFGARPRVTQHRSPNSGI